MDFLFPLVFALMTAIAVRYQMYDLAAFDFTLAVLVAINLRRSA